MDRKLLFACTMTLCLALHPVVAQGQSLWSWGGWAVGLNTPVNSTVTPSSYIYGHVPVAGQIASEVAVGQAILRSGEVVPAPVFSDGTLAADSEVFWTASLWRAQFGSAPCTAWPTLSDGDRCDIAFSGRTLTYAHAVLMNNGHCVLDFIGWPTDDVQVMVIVVAVRQMAPVGTERETWGGLKGRYR